MARKSAQAMAEAVATLVEAVAEAEASPVEAVEEPVLTVAEVEPVLTVPKPAIGAIGKMVEELLKDASLSYFQIVERIADAFPTARTSRRSVASVAADLRRRGVDVPMRNVKLG